MTERIEHNGSFFRRRRGKLVRIPDKWVGRTAHPQTIRKRQSKHTGKIKRHMKNLRKPFLSRRTTKQATEREEW